VGSNPTSSAMSIPDPSVVHPSGPAASPDSIQAIAVVADESVMRLALAEAVAALQHDDVPVGAVVVHAGRIIASRHNEREVTGDPTAHAEVLAMRDAAASVGNWRLDECTMYVTLEPCAMCAGAMVNARLGRLVYGATDPKAGAAGSRFDLIDSALLNHRVPRTTGVLADECGRILVEFFAAKRRK
jgi:tRNA(adenine34) deaminase